MKTKFLTGILIAFALFSCNKEAKQKEADVKETPVAEVVKVTLDLTFTKDDSFHLFFTEDGTNNFAEENSVWIEVKGSPTSQKVVFTLPEATSPTQLRLDFGLNKEQGDITITNFHIDYFGKTFDAPGAAFFNFFGPNEAITKIDKEKGLIMPVKDQAQYFGPSFYSMPALNDELAKMAK
jgi:hypothetical protein